MNQTTTGCANCYYYSNGRCFFGAPCYGTQMIQINGEWVAVPFPPFDDTKIKEKDDEHKL